MPKFPVIIVISNLIITGSFSYLPLISAMCLQILLSKSMLLLTHCSASWHLVLEDNTPGGLLFILFYLFILLNPIEELV